jgi:hypothetical protein
MPASTKRSPIDSFSSSHPPAPTNKTSSMEYFCCCAAISLNNTAITLMERNQHYLSYETLKDALELIADDGKQPIDGCAAAAGQALVQEKLNRASKNLSSSTRPLNRIARRSDSPLIVVLPTTDSPTLDMIVAASSRDSSCYNSYPLHVSPIRIEPIDAESMKEISNQLQVKAVMLYNYSLCLNCVWWSMLGYRRDEFPGRRGAGRHAILINVLREAAAIVANLCLEVLAGVGNSKSTTDPGKTLAIAVVVYSAYMHALEEAGVLVEAVECSAKIIYLNRALVSAFGDSMAHPNLCTASAA